MKYRARITRIFSFVETHYDLTKYNIVRDSKDVYLEVDDVNEADLLEDLNTLEKKSNDLTMELCKYHT